MSFGVIQRVLALLLILFSLTMLVPIGVAFYYGDGGLHTFALSFAIILAIGALAWWPARNAEREFRLRDGFITVALIWTLVGLVGALPFYLSARPVMSVTDAIFESISGLTTTGSTVITGLDNLPHAILYYRQQLHWFGGMGIIVLALAVFPMLGVGGMQLYRAETPGPTKDKLTPRVTETAKALWLIYLGITIACALAYWAGGMSLFDAIGNSYATVATGGYSMHDASFAYYNSSLLDLISAFFMFISGVNFALHYFAFRQRSIRAFFSDTEFRAYLGVMALIITVITLYMYYRGTYPSFGQTLVQSIFQTASMSTSTGFTSTNFALWPTFVPIVLILIGFMGACAGSTTGGIKTVRFVLMFKQGLREVVRVIHPSAEVPVKINGSPVKERVLEGVWGFVAIYVALFAVMFVLLLVMGLDPLSAFSGLETCMNGVGPALGQLVANFKGASDAAKWVFMAAMLLGRLEIFPLLILLMPAFWRR